MHGSKSAARPPQAEPRQIDRLEVGPGVPVLGGDDPICPSCGGRTAAHCQIDVPLGAALLDAPRLGDYQHLVLKMFRLLEKPSTGIDVINAISEIAGERPADAHIHNVIKKLATTTKPICLEQIDSVKRETGHTVPRYSLTPAAEPLLREYADHIEAVHALIRGGGGTCGPLPPPTNPQQDRKPKKIKITGTVRSRRLPSGDTDVPVHPPSEISGTNAGAT